MRNFEIGDLVRLYDCQVWGCWWCPTRGNWLPGLSCRDGLYQVQGLEGNQVLLTIRTKAKWLDAFLCSADGLRGVLFDNLHWRETAYGVRIDLDPNGRPLPDRPERYIRDLQGVGVWP